MMPDQGHTGSFVLLSSSERMGSSIGDVSCCRSFLALLTGIVNTRDLIADDRVNSIIIVLSILIIDLIILG